MRRLAACVAVLAAISAGCVFGPGGIEVRGTFDDVGDLAPGAPVMMADLQIGKVVDISLDGTEAVVAMDIDTSFPIPRDVTARIRRTSLLGERIVDIVADPDAPPGVAALQDGDMIQETETRADLEDLVIAGSDVLAPIAASEVATLVDEGAKGFGGRGEDLRDLLENFSTIVDAYSGRTDDVRGVIENLDRFNTTLARQADAHARSVANTARSFRVLREESEELTAAVRSLSRLAVHARSILDTHFVRMDRFFDQMQVILRSVASEQDAIVELLRWAPFHNRNTQITNYRDFVQVYQDFIICGFNDDPEDPARRCEEVEE